MKRHFVIDPVNPNARSVVDYARKHILKRFEAGEAVSLKVEPFERIKSREQEEKYHALISEIAKKETLHGKKFDAEVWKRALIAAFKHDTVNDPDLKDEWAKFGDIRLMPMLGDRPGFFVVGEQSRKFTKKLATAFIAWLQAFQDGVQ